MLLLLPLLALLADPVTATPARNRNRADEELKFGIDVARRGLWREARFRFERAVELDPERAEAYNDLAIALEQEGVFDKARKAYDEAWRISPNNTYLQQNYDLFREADDKRNRKKKGAGTRPGAAPPAAQPPPGGPPSGTPHPGDPGDPGLPKPPVPGDPRIPGPSGPEGPVTPPSPLP